VAPDLPMTTSPRNGVPSDQWVQEKSTIALRIDACCRLTLDNFLNKVFSSLIVAVKYGDPGTIHEGYSGGDSTTLNVP
jgi:hypothetical protein